jgi:hypothetical protein
MAKIALGGDEFDSNAECIHANEFVSASELVVLGQGMARGEVQRLKTLSIVRPRVFPRLLCC